MSAPTADLQGRHVARDLSAPRETNHVAVEPSRGSQEPGDIGDRGQAVGRRAPRTDAWVRRACALVVAGVAAYSSYAHQRHFALDGGGADQISAALWPLSVDGLVILASLGLVRAKADTTARARLALWGAFLLGVAVSLAANIAAAPTLGWQPVLVAGWPPLALLLAVELVMHSRPRDEISETLANTGRVAAPAIAAYDDVLNGAGRLAVVDAGDSPGSSSTRVRRTISPTAEAVMWAHYENEQRNGRTPTGAELDRVAGTNTYGRAVLARWRRTGRIPALPEP